MGSLGQYRLDLKAPDGTLFAQVTDFLELSCVMRVNAPGLLMVKLPGEHAAIASLQKRSQVELWFEDAMFGINWHRHFSGLHLGEEMLYPQDRPSVFQMTAPGDLWLLNTRTVAWYAGYADRSAFSAIPAETIMKTLVKYNCTSSATVAAGRKREGAIGGATITLEADAGRGTSLDWACHGAYVLKTLQDVAPTGGGDFDLVKTGAATWDFRFYEGQLGTDRRTTVKFQNELGNMVNIRIGSDWTEEKTAATVWGRNDGVDREYGTVLGTDYATGNDVEMYVDARDIKTAAGLTDRGDKAMEENRARDWFTFDVAQTPGCMFAKHYFLGDLVTVRHPKTLVDMGCQVMAVTLTVTPQKREADVQITLRSL